MKLRVTLVLILSVVLALAVTSVINSFLLNEENSSTIGSIGVPNILGLLLGYIFFSSFLISITVASLKFGFVASLPILIINIIFGGLSKLSWLSLLLLAAGLGLAWLILFLKRRQTG